MTMMFDNKRSCVSCKFYDRVKIDDDHSSIVIKTDTFSRETIAISDVMINEASQSVLCEIIKFHDPSIDSRPMAGEEDIVEIQIIGFNHDHREYFPKKLKVFKGELLNYNIIKELKDGGLSPKEAGIFIVQEQTSTKFKRGIYLTTGVLGYDLLSVVAPIISNPFYWDADPYNLSMKIIGEIIAKQGGVSFISISNSKLYFYDESHPTLVIDYPDEEISFSSRETFPARSGSALIGAGCWDQTFKASEFFKDRDFYCNAWRKIFEPQPAVPVPQLYDQGAGLIDNTSYLVREVSVETISQPGENFESFLEQCELPTIIVLLARHGSEVRVLAACNQKFFQKHFSVGGSIRLASKILGANGTGGTFTLSKAKCKNPEKIDRAIKIIRKYIAFELTGISTPMTVRPSDIKTLEAEIKNIKNNDVKGAVEKIIASVTKKPEVQPSRKENKSNKSKNHV